MKKIFTVKEFVTKWKEGQVSAKDYIANIYVPYEEKIALCQQVVDSSYYQKDESGNKTFHVNSPIKYMMFCLVLVDKYTYISIDYKHNLEEFNLLNQTDLVNKLIQEIPKEYKEFKMVLDMIESDLYKNKYEIHSYIDEQVTRVEKIVSAISSSISPEIEKAMKNVDTRKLTSLLNKKK